MLSKPESSQKLTLGYFDNFGKQWYRLFINHSYFNQFRIKRARTCTVAAYRNCSCSIIHIYYRVRMCLKSPQRLLQLCSGIKDKIISAYIYAFLAARILDSGSHMIQLSNHVPYSTKLTHFGWPTTELCGDWCFCNQACFCCCSSSSHRSHTSF